jgi:hypothetical protein
VLAAVAVEPVGRWHDCHRRALEFCRQAGKAHASCFVSPGRQEDTVEDHRRRGVGSREEAVSVATGRAVPDGQGRNATTRWVGTATPSAHASAARAVWPAKRAVAQASAATNWAARGIGRPRWVNPSECRVLRLSRTIAELPYPQGHAIRRKGLSKPPPI